MIYCVCVASKHRKRICTDGEIWVKDKQHEFYVCKKDRGVFESREEALDVITEAYEIVVCERGEA